MKKEVKIIIIIGIILLAYIVYVKNFSKSTSMLTDAEREAKNQKVNEFRVGFNAIQENFCNLQEGNSGVCNEARESFAAGMDWELLYDTYMSGDMTYFDSVNIANHCCGQFYN